MKNKRLLDIFGEIDDRHIAEAAPVAKKSRNKPIWFRWGTIAACMVLVLSVCFGSFAVVAEAKEYKAAVQFFNDYGMSTEGLTRGEIKEVYRDITTKSFTYSKTAEVIRNSISSDNIGGYEIVQDNPTPEDIENLWNYKNYTGGFIGATQTGVHYKYHSEYKEDESLGLEVHDKSYLEKYDGDNLLWSVSISDFWIEDYSIVSDGEIAGVLNFLFDNNIWEISSDELTPMVRDNYTAMLLVCEPNAGKPQEYYSVNGSLGGKLSVSDTGNLLWDVESITSTFFSPATSSFTIGGTSYVFRYTFDTSGMLISQEKTGEVVNYRR